MIHGILIRSISLRFLFSQIETAVPARPLHARISQSYRRLMSKPKYLMRPQSGATLPTPTFSSTRCARLFSQPRRVPVSLPISRSHRTSLSHSKRTMDTIRRRAHLATFRKGIRTVFRNSHTRITSHSRRAHRRTFHVPPKRASTSLTSLPPRLSQIPLLPQVSRRHRSNGKSARPNVCIFCSDPSHFQYACPTVADYISRGLCIRDGGQQLALPNGLRISPRVASGNNLKERIDAWHQQNPSPQRPVASTNLFSVSSSASDGPTDDPWAIFTHEISSSHVDTLDTPQDATLAAPSQRDLEEILVLQNLAASRARVTDDAPERPRVAQFGPTTRAKAYDTPAAVLTPSRDAPPHMSKDPPPVSAPTSAAITPPKAAPAPAPRINRNPFISNTTPQYTYHTPIESPQTVSDVLEQSLDSTVTLTNRQLMAVAPEVRKALKEQIATRRSSAAPVQSAEVNTLSAQDPEAASSVGPTIRVSTFLQSGVSVPTTPSLPTTLRLYVRSAWT